MYIDSTFDMSTVCPLDPPPPQHDNSLLSFLFPSPDATAQRLRARARSLSLMFIYISADGTQRILELEQALQLDLSNPICRHSSARGQGLMRSKKSNAAGGKLR